MFCGPRVGGGTGDPGREQARCPRNRRLNVRACYRKWRAGNPSVKFLSHQGEGSTDGPIVRLAQGGASLLSGQSACLRLASGVRCFVTPAGAFYTDPVSPSLVNSPRVPCIALSSARRLSQMRGDSPFRRLRASAPSEEPLAIDGQTLKGARRDDGRSVPLLAALLHGPGRVLAQRAVERGSNEIPACVCPARTLAHPGTGDQPLMPSIPSAKRPVPWSSKEGRVTCSPSGRARKPWPWPRICAPSTGMPSPLSRPPSTRDMVASSSARSGPPRRSTPGSTFPPSARPAGSSGR